MDNERQSPKNRICATCGLEIPKEAPKGHCPFCLLNADTILASPDSSSRIPTPPAREPVSPIPDDSQSPSLPEFALTVEELRPLFPDLEILELLGAGGMGAVYKGRQPRLDRLVALKVLSCPPEYHDNFSLRFEREAQVLAKLDHPNIVTIFDFGEIEPDQGGKRDRSLFWFLMDFIDGADLNRLIRTNAMTPEQAFRLVPQICDALQYAHDEGITHRDIKPANILVNQKGRVKIADFGLARLIDGEADALVTGLTLTGTSMGTPHYMAPEQWDAPETVDHRADIYSLGVVIYEMLTGERPAGVFDPPSRKVQVDVRMDEVVLKAMEKEPERRYQQASEVKEDVTRVVEEPRDTPRMKRAEKGKGLPVFALGGMALVLLFFGLGKFHQSRSPEVSLEGETPASGNTTSGETNADSVVSIPASGESNASGLFPSVSSQPSGRLRHAGTGPRGESGDFSQAAYLDDFVAVAGSRDFWVGLRANGETVSSDGSLDASGIAKVCASYHTHAVLIDANGQLHFREGKAPSLSDSMEGIRFIDAQVSHRHGIALDEIGRAHIFGEYYEKDFDDGLGASGYGTPRWPSPKEEALTDVQAVAVAHTHAATLKKDGSLRVFGWEGMVELPTEVTSKTFTRIASSEDQVCLLDTDGRAWRFGLARNPHSDQPMGAAGKLLRIGQETATDVGNETWRDEEGRWHSRDKTIDQLLDDHLPGDAPHFVRKWITQNDLNTSLVWLEVNSDHGVAKAAPPIPAFGLKSPKPLDALRKRGGRLRSWSAGEEKLTGLELAEGIDDFIRLDGFAGFNPDRWLAIRRGGPSVTSLTDFERAGELVSLNSHLGVLRSGEIVKCYGDKQRQVLPGGAIGSGYGHSTEIQFELVLNRYGRVQFRRAPNFGHWLEDEFPRVRERLAEVDDAVDIDAGANGSGMLLRASGEVIAWNQAGLWPSEKPLSDAVSIALGDHFWLALRADGSVHVQPLPGKKSAELLPPADLGPAYAIRASQNVAAAQMADGSWRAWGPERHSGLVRKIEDLGPAADILFLALNEGGHLFWIEGKDDDETVKGAPMLEVPPALQAMRERGGRLRSWAAGEQEIMGTELAEGFDDFVRLDGLAFPGADRWLAVRRDGPSVTPLADFVRSGELVSLDTHLGVLRSGEVLHCWEEQRNLKSRDAIDGETGPGGGTPFWLFLNRDQTVDLTPNGDFRPWRDDEFPRVRPLLEPIDDAVQIEGTHSAGIVLRENGEAVSWSSDEGLIVPDPPLTDAVEVACLGSGRWFSLSADGSIRTWNRPGADWLVIDPPKTLPPAFAIRAMGTVCAAQMADGSWRAWGKDNQSGLIDRIESIGPAVDILFLSQTSGEKDALLWIEPAGSFQQDETRPKREIPEAWKVMRERGGRLRSWAPNDDIIGLELAEGIDDFVRLDGILYPNSDRWLAVRQEGASVTPLADFGRSGELVSLDTHLGVLVSGEVVDCFGAQPRKIKLGNVVDSGYAGHGVQFGLFLNRDGTVTLDRAFKDGQWFKNDAERIQQRLAEVNDAIKIDTGPGNGIVLRKSGEIIAWNDDGLWSPDPEITDAIDIAMGGNCWAALRADGSVHTESPDGKVPLPSEGLPSALAIRAAGTVVAAQLADGSWRAWGGDSKLIEQIHAIGPAVDLLFLNQRLLWIEPVGE